jgi:hypothetical protein
MTFKVELKEKLVAVDLGARSLWDELDETNQKALKNELFILNRYISNVKGQPRDIQEHFVLTVNEYFNKHWNTLQKHPKLLWQLLCMCSYNNQKIFFHEWIGLKKKNSSNKKGLNFLLQIYPNRKQDELELLAELMTPKEFKELAKDLGYSDKEIKDLF